MRETINTILSETPAEIFYTLIGALALFIIQRVFIWVKKQLMRKKIKSEIKRYQNKFTTINIVDLVTGVPEIRKNDIRFRQITTLGEMKSLYIGMSKEHLKQLHEKEKNYSYDEGQKNIFHSNNSFDGTSNFKDLAELTEIEQLPELISKHCEIIGEQFINSQNGLLFNDSKFGIFDLRETRFGEKENSGVEIDLFVTDYFTHRVFRSIYDELKQKNHPIQSANRDNFLQYRPFLTSFGINTLLICEGENGKEIVLSKRSSRVHGSKAKYHITMNEGLNILDKDSFGTINLENLLKRGLQEELGIDEGLYQLITKSAFYDLFLDRRKFEIGITSSIHLTIDFNKYILPKIARDKHLEFDSFNVIPMKMKDIKNFINKNEFIPHGLYTLDRVLLREKISNTSLLI